MNYSTELPRQYKTWLSFYDATKHLIAKAEHEGITDIVVQEKTLELNTFIHNENLPIKEFNLERKYAFRQIKDNAFEEILSDRMTKEEILKNNYQIEAILASQGYIKDSIIIKYLGTVKRILLTQSK